jgi:hypothetical protein
MADSKAMDEDTYQGAVKALLEDAADYIDTWIAPARALATQYYRGDAFGNEEEGRSQIVMTEVRDVVQAMLPPLLRIFTGSDQIVEFVPTNANTVEQAAQQTDYVNHVFYKDNPGFGILHSWFKDALTRKGGIVKWRWATDTTITETAFTDLAPEQVAVLKQDEGTEILSEEEKPAAPLVGPDGQPIPQPSTFDVRIKRHIPRDRAIVEVIPPEEFICIRDTRDLDTTKGVAHRAEKSVSDLVALGYDQEEIEEYIGSGGDNLAFNSEAITRNPAFNAYQTQTADPATKTGLYTEAYLRIDKDGDGIAELRKVCTLGSSHNILHDEVVSEVPFAFLCPDPEPHMLFGQSIADQVMDLQRIKSNVVRNTLDSLAQVIHPRLVVVETQVNIDDVLNTETGGIIRARAPGAVQPLSEPFVGQAAMPIIGWLDQVRAARTGVNPATSQGLDPDVLQSTSANAVANTIAGGQERIELVARIFAETGVKRLFRGLNKLLVQNQDKPRIIRLRGKFVSIDPRVWDADLDVSVDVALGRGTDRDKMQFLMLVAGKQEQIIQLLGPVNPICDVQQYRNTLAQICNLAGFKDDTRYFKQVDVEALKQHFQNMPQKPDPSAALVQIEQQKVQAEAMAKNQRLQLDAQEHERRFAFDQWKANLQATVDREGMRLRAAVDLAETEAKYATQVNMAHVEGQLDADQAHADRIADLLKHVHGTETQAHVDRHATETQALVDAHATEAQAQTDREAAAAQAAQPVA